MPSIAKTVDIVYELTFGLSAVPVYILYSESFAKLVISKYYIVYHISLYENIPYRQPLLTNV